MVSAADKSYLALKARELGFVLFGTSRAQYLAEDASFLKKWLAEGKQGSMSWMNHHLEKRTNPALLQDNCKSVISLAFRYFPKLPQPIDGTYKIAKYAYGKDYHKVLRKKLKVLVNILVNELGSISSRGFVDSAPIMEKAWASRSGLGWIGKNTNLINRKEGSFLFLAEILTDLEFEEDQPARDLCRTCTLCIDACPTHALEIPYQIDASRCISYMTIERKEEISKEFHGKLDDWIFGCDICQDVCPWNKNAIPHDEAKLDPRVELHKMTKDCWDSLDREDFDTLFEGSAVKRAGFEGILKNKKALTKPVL